MKYFTGILITLLLIACCVIAWFYFNPKIEKVYVQIKPKPEIIYTEKEDGGTIATIETQIGNNAAETLSEKYIGYVNDTLVPAINKGLKYKAEVTQLTRINAALRDSLTKKNIVVNTVKKDVIEWKTKYIQIAANPTDSTVTYAYNAQLDVAEYEKKESLFGDRKSYIAITSPDENLKINGVENFTKELKYKKDVLQLKGKIQGFYFNKDITPYGGLDLIIAPDSRFNPIISAGYFYSSGNFHQFYSGGLQFNILKL